MTGRSPDDYVRSTEGRHGSLDRMNEHLTSATIARLASGRLEGAERDAALAHTDACEGCRGDLTYVVGFERRRRRRRAAILVGGVLTVVIAIFLIPPTRQITGPSTVRSGGEGVPTVASYLPANGAEVGRDSIAFVWQDMGPNTNYRLWLSTATGEPVLNRAVRDTSAYVEVTPPLMSGQAYFWFIDALMDDGGVARSSVWRFTIPE